MNFTVILNDTANDRLHFEQIMQYVSVHSSTYPLKKLGEAFTSVQKNQMVAYLVQYIEVWMIFISVLIF